MYVDYNVLGLYIKLFALYNSVFLWRLEKPKTGLKPFSTTENRFSKNPVLTSLEYIVYHEYVRTINA